MDVTVIITITNCFLVCMPSQVVLMTDV